MKNIPCCKVLKNAEPCQDLDSILLAPSAASSRGYVPSNKKLITMERFHVLQLKKWPVIGSYKRFLIIAIYNVFIN